MTGAWIAIFGMIWCCVFASLAMFELLPHPTFYAQLAALVMNGEALRYNIIVRRKIWKDSI